jgi:NADPH-dependent ferric siderophore reductase
VSVTADEEFTATLAAIQPELLARVNDDFEDAVVFVARVLGGHPEARTAEITAIDRRGVTVAVDGAGAERSGRIDFAAPLDSPLELQDALFELIIRARTESGESGTTSAEREAAEMSAIGTFLAEVVSVADVHPHLRRVVVAGDDLARFAPTGPDTFVYVLLPPPGREHLTIDQSFTWEGFEQMAAADSPVGAYYTVRRWEAARREVTMLMVRHGDEGPASAWGDRAKPGDPVALWGPRTAYHPPAQTDWHLLVADETGLPAVAAIMETLPAGAVARVFAEVTDDSERQVLPSAPGFDVTWLYRNGAPAGTTTLLADAVRATPWPGGTPYVWGGGESRAMTAVRRYVRGDLGLTREAVSLVAYWRHASSPPDA